LMVRLRGSGVGNNLTMLDGAIMTEPDPPTAPSTEDCANGNDGSPQAVEVNETISDNNHQEKEIISNIPSLVVAFCASLTTGATTYSFGLYSATLQKTLHLTQGQVDTISTAFFVAGLFSFIPGFCSDRFGTRFSLCMGGMLGCVNLLLYWVVATRNLVLPRWLIVPTLSLLGINTFLSSALVTGSVFKTITIATQGGSNKGTAVGIAKGYVGLGSGLYVAIFESLRLPGESNLDFLPMAACFCIMCASLPGFLLLPTKEQVAASKFRDDATPNHFRVLYASLMLMMVFIVGNSLAELFHGGNNFELEGDLTDEALTLRPPKHHYGMAIMLTTIWLLPIYSWFVLPKKRYDQVLSERIADDEEETRDETSPDTEGAHSEDATEGLTNENNEEISLLESSDHQEADEMYDDEHSERGPESPQAEPPQTQAGEVFENMNLVQMLRTKPALLMLWTTTILVGAGTLESNNMGQMVEALGFDAEVTPASLALFSVAQSLARIFTGALSESAVFWKSFQCGLGRGVRGVPRPFFLVVASFVGLFSHIVLGLATSQNVFVIGAALSGAAFGMVWPLMVLVVGEVFGPANVGANYMFYDGFTSAAGTFLLSKIVAQDVYEAHIPPPNHHHLNSTSIDERLRDEDDLTCFGSGCFQMTHWIVAAMTVTCIVTSLAMQIVTRSVYREKIKAAQEHDHAN